MISNLTHKGRKRNSHYLDEVINKCRNVLRDQIRSPNTNQGLVNVLREQMLKNITSIDPKT